MAGILSADILKRGPFPLSLLAVLSTLIAVTASCFAADGPPPARAIGAADLEKGVPLPALIRLKDMEETYLASGEKNEYLERLGILYSRTGMYWQALESFDRTKPPGAAYQENDTDWIRAEPALSVIAAAARGRKAVFLNEAYHVPQHRMFATLLMKELRKAGFRYLAVGSLNESDKELSSRGYPLISRTGYYTDEPVYGDLIRTALRLGFKVVPYEAPDKPCLPPPEDRAYCLNLRDSTRARNIFSRTLGDDPEAGVMVLAGYGQIDEKGSPAWTPMARAFRAVSGVDPLTIDQVDLMAHSSREYEDPLYDAILNTTVISGPSVLRGQDGRLWTAPWRRNAYDIQVVHPRAAYRRGRPDWLLEGTGRKTLPVPED
ncbi:MAG TPA: hypothetical protein PL037_02305, partial [Elusimicrobiales bacterium]|nr:hypothetical protein [Elusimicrobiales bacterium]